MRWAGADRVRRCRELPVRSGGGWGAGSGPGDAYQDGAICVRQPRAAGVRPGGGRGGTYPVGAGRVRGRCAVRLRGRRAGSDGSTGLAVAGRVGWRRVGDAGGGRDGMYEAGAPRVQWRRMPCACLGVGARGLCTPLVSSAFGGAVRRGWRVARARASFVPRPLPMAVSPARSAVPGLGVPRSVPPPPGPTPPRPCSVRLRPKLR